MPDTIERFLEVDELMTELLLMFQVLFHQQPQVTSSFTERFSEFYLKIDKISRKIQASQRLLLSRYSWFCVFKSLYIYLYASLKKTEEYKEEYKQTKEYKQKGKLVIIM